MKITVSNLSISTSPVYPSKHTKNSNIEIEADVLDFDNIDEIIYVLGEDRLLDHIGVNNISSYVEQNTNIISEIDTSILLDNVDHSNILEELIQSLGGDTVFDMLPQEVINARFRDHVIDDILDDDK